MTFDPDQFEERAAIMEYDGGMTRFDAETQAARLQGVHRWEAIHAVARRVVEATRHRVEVARQSRPDNVPGMQPHPKEENRPMPECEQDAGRGGVELLALRMERGTKG
jgi:hypothetical protein